MFFTKKLTRNPTKNNVQKIGLFCQVPFASPSLQQHPTATISGQKTSHKSKNTANTENMVNLSRTPERCMLPRSETLTTPPLLKRTRDQELQQQRPMLCPPFRTSLPSPLLLIPDDLENCAPTLQGRVPRFSLKPRPLPRKLSKKRATPAPLTEMLPLKLDAQVVTPPLKRRKTPSPKPPSRLSASRRLPLVE